MGITLFCCIVLCWRSNLCNICFTRFLIFICIFIVIAAGEMLKFDENPASHTAKKENVDQVLHFMAAHRIKMRQISSKGLKNSNLILLTLKILIMATEALEYCYERSGTVKLMISGTTINCRMFYTLYMDLL